MRCLMHLLLLLCTTLPVAAEVAALASGDALVVPLEASAETTNQSLRTLTFIGVQTMTVSGTWDDTDLLAEQRGNTLILGLRNPEVQRIVLVVHGDNGTMYQLHCEPAAAGAVLEPTIQVVAKPPSAGADHGQRTEGYGQDWETVTSKVMRLHQHIRGGANFAEIGMTPIYNKRILVEEQRRVIGDPMSQEDDFRIIEYLRWELRGVRASYIGVTYTGRSERVELPYPSLETDRTVAIWYQDQSGTQALDPKNPVVVLDQGREAFFVLYRDFTNRGQ